MLLTPLGPRTRSRRFSESIPGHNGLWMKKSVSCRVSPEAFAGSERPEITWTNVAALQTDGDGRPAFGTDRSVHGARGEH